MVISPVQGSDAIIDQVKFKVTKTTFNSHISHLLLVVDGAITEASEEDEAGLKLALHVM